MNYRRKTFCEEYLNNNGNATQAALKAGYSEDRAEVTGSELTKEPEIIEYLEERGKQIRDALGINPERVLREYSRIAFTDLRKFYTVDGALKSIHDLGEDEAASLAGVETTEIATGYGEEKMVLGETKKIKTYDKIKALDSLSRFLGMFEKDNSQIKPVVNIVGMEIK